MNVGDLGLRLRNTALGLVAFVSIIANIVFIANNLDDAISRYTLLVYLLFMMALVALLEQTVIRDEDVREALASNVYPARVRTPMRVSFTPYIAVWLLWWFVSQLVYAPAQLEFEADDTHAGALFALILLVPLVLLALSLEALFDFAPRRRNFIIMALLVATVIALFFPTHEWAPQRSNGVWTAVRVVFYFFSILGHEKISPPNVYANIGSDPTPANNEEHDVEAQRLTEKRRARVYLILDAYDRIDTETLRVREFIALSAWVLVVPVYLLLLIYPLSIAATIYAGRRDKARVVDPTEMQKVHPLPTTIVLPTSAASVAAATHTMPRYDSEQLPAKITLPARRAAAAAALPQPTSPAPAQPPSTNTATTLPGTPTIHVTRNVF